MSTSYERLTFKGIGYNSAARFLMYLFATLSSIVLGRCLSARDYGIVSFAFIFVNFAANFADFGIGSAVIQRKELDPSATNTAFTLKCIIGAAVIAVTFGLSSFAPVFLDDPQITLIIRLLSLYFVITIVSFLPTALLTREMDFRKISIADTTLSLINSGTAIILALSGFGYWSIVAAYLIANTVAAVLLNLFRPVPVRLHLDRSQAREFISFGGSLFLSSLLVFLMFNLDNFIIGSVRGSGELGYYAVAYNWGSMICVMMYLVVLRVVFPLMAKLQDEEGRLRSTYLKTVEYSAYIVVLVNVVLFAVSREFLVCVLGHNSDKWLPALGALRILCLYGILRGLLEPIGQVIVARGETRVLLKANIAASAIEATAVYPALVFFGIEGVAWTVTIAYLSQYFVYYPYLKNRLRIRISEFAAALRPAFLAALPILALSPLVAGYREGSILVFLAKASAMAALYVAIIGLTTSWEIFRLMARLLSDGRRTA